MPAIESSQGHEVASLLSFYSPIVRHYSSAASDSLEGILFKLTRVQSYDFFPQLHKTLPSKIGKRKLNAAALA